MYLIVVSHKIPLILAQSDFGFTLLKPKDEAGQKAMQDKELLNGRLAMFAIGT
jgi:hypothetical protein